MATKSGYSFLDLPKLVTNVPGHHIRNVTKTIVRMFDHPAYGRDGYRWTPNDFEVGSQLGRGKFGRVYLARERKTEFLVAMKVMVKSELTKYDAEEQVLREIEIQSRLKHPHILRLYTWFHDDRRIYLALELASGGELYQRLLLAPNGRFNERRVARYTYQVADALNYCHANNVIHRDVKAENVLLTDDDNVKLADFGWSAHTPSNKRSTLCGTLDYLPPEMLTKKPYHDTVDQWSLGVLCYELLVGNPPFMAENSPETYVKIRRGQIHYPQFMSAGAKDVVSKLLRRTGSNRMSLVEVMQHSWIQEMMNV